MTEPEQIKQSIRDNQDGTATVRLFKRDIDNPSELPDELSRIYVEHDLSKLDDTALMYKLLQGGETVSYTHLVKACGSGRALSRRCPRLQSREP